MVLTDWRSRSTKKFKKKTFFFNNKCYSHWSYLIVMSLDDLSVCAYR